MNVSLKRVFKKKMYLLPFFRLFYIHLFTNTYGGVVVRRGGTGIGNFSLKTSNDPVIIVCVVYGAQDRQPTHACRRTGE